MFIPGVGSEFRMSSGHVFSLQLLSGTYARMEPGSSPVRFLLARWRWVLVLVASLCMLEGGSVQA